MMMNKLILFSLILLTATRLTAQLSDNFSDGDFSQNPAWTGDTNDFKVNSSFKLQLRGNGSDTSYLSTPNLLINNTQWTFYIKQSFNSSANNHSRIYLCSDQSNLKGNLHGYFVQFGSSQDNISLYRQDSNSISEIIHGNYGNTGASTNTFTIKVLHDTAGRWTLYSDPNAGHTFISEGQTIDTTYQSSSYFGLFCKYTSSNATKFYFDDFLVEPIPIDSVAPGISKVLITDQHHLDIYFNEALDSTTAQNPAHYALDHNIGLPAAAVIDPATPSLVHLDLGQKALVQGQSYTLTATGISDLIGNTAYGLKYLFDYYIPQAFDLLINEIMADPTPAVGLPPYEYIELYNRSNFAVNLGGWSLVRGSTASALPDSSIAPHAYLLLCKDNNVSAFQNMGMVLGLSSFTLRNSGEQLMLRDDKGRLIHQVHYSDNWYGQSSKSEGGWSLEQIDPDNPCGCASNWWASESKYGGTPGSINSVDASQPDLTQPSVKRIAVIDSLHLRVHFTESMDSASILRTVAYEIIDSIGYANTAVASYPDYQSVLLSLSKALKHNKVYKLVIRDTLKDCLGNPIVINSAFALGFAEVPQAGDVVFNEILFNPKPQGIDFVELYNRSNKIIELKNLFLADKDEYSGALQHLSLLSDEAYALFPGEYIVLCTGAEVLKSQYWVKNPDKIIEMKDFPSLPDDHGNVYLLSPWQSTLDSLYYDKNMHFPLLADDEGVSLERINYEQASVPSNWHSAAESVGYATPTAQNSQFSASESSPGELWLEPEIFSPDNDGYHDVLNIYYRLPAGSVIAQAIIYDTKGRIVKNLASNVLASTNGVLHWDGTSNENTKAPVGLYIVYLEIFDAQGNTEHYKLISTLGSRL